MPPVPIGNLLTKLPALVRQAIRMRFEGRSTARGVRPAWLEQCSDVRVVRVFEEQHAHISFDAPRFGDVAAELYDQTELWEMRPSPDDTGFDLLGDALTDLSAGNVDSQRYDNRMLRQFSGLGRVINGSYQEVVITSQRYTRERPAVLNQASVETAKELHSMTPSPARVRVAGELDMIRASTHSFALRLDDGSEVRGVLDSDDLSPFVELFGKRVVASGQAAFRPSGRLLILEADGLEVAGPQATIWSRMPRPVSQGLARGSLRRTQGPRSGLAALVGQWPGDESDEEIGELLRQLS